LPLAVTGTTAVARGGAGAAEDGAPLTELEPLRYAVSSGSGCARSGGGAGGEATHGGEEPANEAGSTRGGRAAAAVAEAVAVAVVDAAVGDVSVDTGGDEQTGLNADPMERDSFVEGEVIDASEVTGEGEQKGRLSGKAGVPPPTRPVIDWTTG